MFDYQVEALADRYRCVRIDFRGQGRSAVPRSGYDMDSLLGDVLAVIEKLQLGPVHLVGLSMGGFVGMRLASRRPDLTRSLTLIGSAAGPESPDNLAGYRMLNFVARWFGLHMVVNRVMRLMFGRKFLMDPNRSTFRREMRRRLLSNHRLGATRAVKSVIDRRGVLEEIGRIRCPTLILVGDQDRANTPDRSRQIQTHIGGSLLRLIPGAGHTPTIEEPGLVNISLNHFLENIDGRLPVLPPLPEEDVDGNISGEQAGSLARRKKAAGTKRSPTKATTKKKPARGKKASPKSSAAGRKTARKKAPARKAARRK